MVGCMHLRRSYEHVDCTVQDFKIEHSTLVLLLLQETSSNPWNWTSEPCTDSAKTRLDSVLLRALTRCSDTRVSLLCKLQNR